ncbi:MAG: CPBP family intramembrane metalloprotease [Christensenellaceae bacterium]|nr:CPBP family intramembrane metalloprotease [Christensenellaceae bacterium]
MTKTFKIGIIYFISVISLVVARIVFAQINLSDNISSWTFSFIFQIVALGLIPFLLYRIWVGGSFREYAIEIHLNKKLNPAIYILAVLAGLCTYFINVIVSMFSRQILIGWGYTYASSVSTIYSSPEVLIFDIIATALLPAVFEEIANRGLLLATLNGQRSERLKVLIVAVMFGLVHQNIAQFPSAFISGIILAWVALKARSILPAMIIHFMNNFLIIMGLYSSQRSGIYYNAINNFFSIILSNIIFFVFSLTICIIILIYTVKSMRKFRKGSTLKLMSEEDMTKFLAEEAAITDTPEIAEFSEVFENVKQEKEEVAEIDIPVEEPREATVNYIPLILAALLATVSTLFTFIWGLMR